jgi:hypothetical protein
MVGLFWVVEEAGSPAVITLAVPCAQAALYGDMLTIDDGHLDCWTQLARRGAPALRAAGRPTAPVWSDYDEWPRGRVLYDCEAQHFVIRADRQLHRPALLSLLAASFGIEMTGTTVFPDEHYRSVRSVSLPQPR